MCKNFVRGLGEIPYKQYLTFSFSTLGQFFSPVSTQDDQLKQISRGGESGSKITVLLVDDHSLVRKAIRKIIDRQQGMTVVGEAAGGEEAIRLSRRTSPDIILMDVNMPGIDGIETTRRIIAEMPGIRIIGLSTNDKKIVVDKMKSAGASAYLSKDDAFDSLIDTIRNVAAAP